MLNPEENDNSYEVISCQDEIPQSIEHVNQQQFFQNLETDYVFSNQENKSIEQTLEMIIEMIGCQNCKILNQRNQKLIHQNCKSFQRIENMELILKKYKSIEEEIQQFQLQINQIIKMAENHKNSIFIVLNKKIDSKNQQIQALEMHQELQQIINQDQAVIITDQKDQINKLQSEKNDLQVQYDNSQNQKSWIVLQIQDLSQKYDQQQKQFLELQQRNQQQYSKLIESEECTENLKKYLLKTCLKQIHYQQKTEQINLSFKNKESQLQKLEEQFQQISQELTESTKNILSKDYEILRINQQLTEKETYLLRLEQSFLLQNELFEEQKRQFNEEILIKEREALILNDELKQKEDQICEQREELKLVNIQSVEQSKNHQLISYQGLQFITQIEMILQQQAELSQLHQELNQIQMIQNESEILIKQKEQKIQAFNQQLTSNVAEIRELQKGLQEKDQMIKDCQTQFNQQILRKDEQFSLQSCELKQKENFLQQSKGKIISLEWKSVDQDQKILNLQEQLQEQKNSYQQMNNSQTQLKQIIQSQEEEINSFNQQIQTNLAQISELQQGLLQKDQMIKEQQTQLNQKISIKEKEIFSHLNELKLKDSQIQQYQEKIRTLDSQLIELYNQYKAIQQKQKAESAIFIKQKEEDIQKFNQFLIQKTDHVTELQRQQVNKDQIIKDLQDQLHRQKNFQIVLSKQHENQIAQLNNRIREKQIQQEKLQFQLQDISNKSKYEIESYKRKLQESNYKSDQQSQQIQQLQQNKFNLHTRSYSNIPDQTQIYQLESSTKTPLQSQQLPFQNDFRNQNYKK